MKLALLSLLSALAIFHSQPSWAFPEMISHGYVNCTSCHISPNGGGVLSPYGRQISADVLSSWGGDGEAKPFYGVFNQPAWIDTQAYVRGVQTAQNTDAVSSGHYWWMEGDLEGAAHFGPDQRWTVDLAFGISPDVLNGIQVPGTSTFISRRQYVMYQATETMSVRAGKFIADYGVYFPDHTIPTRQGIGFDEGQETYNVEYAYRGEKYSASFTVDLGRLDDPSLLLEKGVVANGAINLTDNKKVGWSGYFGTQNGNNRELTGPYTLIGITDTSFFLAEADLQFTQPAGFPSTSGVVSYERLGFFPVKGFELYLMEQTYVYDFGGNFNPMIINPQYGIMTNRLYGAGPGFYWFPRPHFYIQFEVQQQASPSFPSAQTAAFLVGSIYL
jgi:hypothetical protein